MLLLGYFRSVMLGNLLGILWSYKIIMIILDSDGKVMETLYKQQYDIVCLETERPIK